MLGVLLTLFQSFFRLIQIAIIGGFFTAALIDIQKRAFESKRTGLVSMLQVNQQFVGRTR